MEIKELYYQVKTKFQNLILQKETRAKIPRKKIEIQFNRALKQLNAYQNLLKKFIESNSAHSSVLKLGTDLLEEIKRFQELQLMRITSKRLTQLSSSFIHPIDFTQGILHLIKSYTEEIHQFLQTKSVEEL